MSIQHEQIHARQFEFQLLSSYGGFYEGELVNGLLALARTHVAYNPGRPKSTWDFEAKPQCFAQGIWKYTLVKADMKIVYSLNPTIFPRGTEQLDVNYVDGITEPDRCRKYNQIELTLLNQSAASECSNLPPDSELRCKYLKVLKVGTLKLFSKKETIAHEAVHYEHFKSDLTGSIAYPLTEPPWTSFFSSILVEPTFNNFPTLSSAKRRIKNIIIERKQYLEQGAAIVFNYDAKHPKREDFVLAELEAIQPIIDRINQLRITHSCQQ
jgi:hypothetical protein